MGTKPFFIPQKEIDMINSMNKELIDDLVGQSVDIYKIEIDETEANLYGESDNKFFGTGYRVNCLLRFNEPEVEMIEGVGADINSNIEMFFLDNSLSGSNFYPEIGDITDWNDFYWEINSVTEPQLIGGHPNFNHTIKAAAHRSRISSLQIEERPR